MVTLICLVPGWNTMDSPDIALEIIDLFCRRRVVLARLVEEPGDKRTLADELDISRSTLDRATRELEAVDAITYKEGRYTVTPIGEWFVRDFFSYLERLQLALEFEPFLQWIPVDEFDLDLRHLKDAELFLPESGDPYAMVNHHVRTLSKADEFSGILPLIGLHAFEAAYEQVVENGASHEIIVEEDIVETLATKECYASKFQQLRNCTKFTLSKYNGSIPYFVGIFDNEKVQIGVDEDGEPRALVETSQPEVRAWAKEAISEYREHATTLSQSPLQERSTA